MQVFLPYPSYKDSVECLDNKRLGNQIYREAKTLVSGGWRNHPASKMWYNYRYSLCDYAIAGLVELEKRGRFYPKWFIWFKEEQKKFDNTGLPHFIGNEEFHASHRSNLLRKDLVHYGKFGWKENSDLAYVWPV